MPVLRSWVRPFFLASVPRCSSERLVHWKSPKAPALIYHLLCEPGTVSPEPQTPEEVDGVSAGLLRARTPKPALSRVLG